METKTYKIEDLEFTEDQIIHFEQGLPGFKHLKRFVIFTNPDFEPFHFMHSVDEEGVRFVIINPLLFKSDYDPVLNKSQIADLDLKQKEDLLFYVIVTLQPQMEESTANMLGPVLINIRTQKGKQIILEDSRYSVSERIIGGGA